ncbi:DNA topoisomerase IV, partial [Sulfurimonas sp.]|nr:DNA topoisomerase IV [Sulfurimonas sp.]
ELTLEDDSEEELDLESQIENAVGELSEEDLESEIDGDVLLNIDSLTSKDLKMAIGEEVTEESSSESNEDPELDELEDSSSKEEELTIPTDTEITPDDEGVESLKALLTALTDKNVSASLKGMKININITLGDK